MKILLAEIQAALAEIQAAILGLLHPGFIPITLGAAYKIYRTHPTRQEAVDIIISSWMILYCFGDTVLELSHGQLMVFVMMGLGSTGLMHWMADNAEDFSLRFLLSKLKSLLVHFGVEINVKKLNSASNGQTN